MHYNDSPYPDPQFYTKDNRRISDYRVPSIPTPDTWNDWYPDTPCQHKRVLIVGCGTVEAIMAAATNPYLTVVAIDSSAASIRIAREIAESEGVKNLSLHHSDLAGWWDPQLYDIVIASGILHHIRDVATFLARIRALLVNDGRFVVMVYGNYVRSFMPGFCQALAKLGLAADSDGVEATSAVLEALPEHHPVKEFYSLLPHSDSQATDTWLHSYFRNYSASEVINLVEPFRFSFRRWISQDRVDSRVIDALPQRFGYLKDRFAALSANDRYDICQVLNNNDLTLTALFVTR